MVKKLSRTSTKKAATPASLPEQLVSTIKGSAQQLLDEGRNVLAKAQSVAEEKLGGVTGKLGTVVNDIAARRGESLSRLQAVFEARKAQALRKLGLPTVEDVAELSERVQKLSKVVSRLSKDAPPAAPRKRAAAAAETSAA